MIGEVLELLLVEDDDDHAELVKRCFAENQVANTMRRVKDGEEALSYLFRGGQYADAAKSPTPNLVLLDLRLPKVDGIDVLKAIKASERLRNIPVVVLTTSNSERDVALAYAGHANSYLVKPAGYQEFAEMIEALRRYWLVWNRNPLRHEG